MMPKVMRQMAQHGGGEVQERDLGKGHKGWCKSVMVKPISTWSGRFSSWHDDGQMPTQNCDDHVRWAQAQKEEGTADAVGLELGEESAEVLEFSSAFESELCEILASRA